MRWPQLQWSYLLYALFALTLLAAGTSWFLNNFELKQVDSYTGYRGEARSNSLFAARLFLKRMGIPAERRDGLLTLPPPDSVIILNTERYTLSAAKTEALLAWVAAGGHLITRARSDTAPHTAGEARTDARFSTEDRDLLQERLNIRIGPHIMPDDDALPVLFQPANSAETLSVELNFFHSLHTTRTDAAHYQLAHDTWFIDQPYGAGHVSLFAELDFFENYLINNADHGKMLWYLVHSHIAQPQRVWLLHQDTLPSLFTLLLRHAAPVLLVGVALLLFSFWALIPRFGAIIPEPPPQRRRLLDHIKASARFMWKRQDKGREQLCQTLQHSLNSQAQRRIPGWQLMSTTEQYAALSAYLQPIHAPPFTPDHLQHLLTATALDEHHFTRLVQLVQCLRNPR